MNRLFIKNKSVKKIFSQKRGLVTCLCLLNSNYMRKQNKTKSKTILRKKRYRLMGRWMDRQNNKWTDRQLNGRQTALC